jgi:hypothetical protein
MVPYHSATAAADTSDYSATAQDTTASTADSYWTYSYSETFYCAPNPPRIKDGKEPPPPPLPIFQPGEPKPLKKQCLMRGPDASFVFAHRRLRCNRKGIGLRIKQK